MIKKVNITQFGSFKDFDWNRSVRKDGQVLEFKRVNILYGRNYSGKTTLSRVIRSLEQRRLPDKCKDACFVVTTDEAEINETQVASHNLNVRVYNRDFVDDHLSFLKDENGNITPFAVVGSENKAIDRQIKDLERLLGTEEGRTGLRGERAEKQADLKAKQRSLKQAEKQLQDKLVRKASAMKHVTLYRDPNYNRRKLQVDMETVRRKAVQVLSEEKRWELQSLLAQEALPDIKTNLKFAPAIERLYQAARELLGRRITPSRPIRELLEDAILQTWVKEGIRHHRGKRTTCGFCGQTLPADLWEKLDAHFSKESEELSEELARHIAAIDAEIMKAQTIFTLREDRFYPTIQRRFRELNDDLQREIAKYITELKAIKAQLEARRGDIFTPRPLPALSCNGGRISELISEINALISENNQQTRSLAQDQEKARHRLRLSEVAQFIQDSGVLDDEKHIAEFKKKANDAEKGVQALTEKIEAQEREIQDLRAQLTDERKGAERVNQYLKHFFGHSTLRLQAVEEPSKSSYTFKIFRGTEPAYNLSEGECSLVAFCYFVAKLEDAETKGKDLIVYIDDPISSLDSNHIFFVYSLIEGMLKNEGTNNYRQIFISTHNLDFLKYFQRLPLKGSDRARFLIEMWGGHSQIKPMPKYLEKYITEFNYLFEQIYKCSSYVLGSDRDDDAYSFGNNLRRFLEAYLFFKYPNRNGFQEKLVKFFGGDTASAVLLKKLVDEHSHLEEAIDRSMRPLDVPEMSKLADFVLKTIREKDPEQYNALLESIGVPRVSQIGEDVASAEQ